MLRLKGDSKPPQEKRDLHQKDHFLSQKYAATTTLSTSGASAPGCVSQLSFPAVFSWETTRCSRYQPGLTSFNRYCLLVGRGHLGDILKGGRILWR